MVDRRFPEPEPKPRIRLILPADGAFAAVAATAVEVLLAGLPGDPEPTVAAVREAVAASLAGNVPTGGGAELELARTDEHLTLTVPERHRRGGAGDGPPEAVLGGLAHEARSAGGRLTLSWRLSGG